MTHWTDYLDPEGPDGAYLSWKKVEPRVGISRTTAWRLQRSGEFPKPYVISSGRVAYRESEVEAWKASRGHRAEAPRTVRREPKPSPAPPPRPPDRSPQASAPFQPAFALEAPPAPAQAARATRVQKSRSSAATGDQMRFDF